MLSNFKDHVKKINQCIEENQNFLFKIVSHTNEMFENRDQTRITTVSDLVFNINYENSLLVSLRINVRNGFRITNHLHV